MLNIEKIIDYFEKKPAAVREAIMTIGLIWSFLGWMNAVQRHNDDLKLIIPAVEKMTNVQTETNSIMHDLNSGKWIRVDTAAH